MQLDKPFLVISDAQIPFENHKALYFCSYLKRHYNVPDENIVCVGDETDGNFAGMYPKDPNATHTAISEIRQARHTLKEWAAVFPKMMVCISNHGMRVWKKATAAELPSQVLKTYHEIFDLPEAWVYKDKWHIPTRSPWQAIHGVELSGKTPYRQAAELFNISTVFGHLHSSAGIAYINTGEKNIWAMNTGSLIDPDSYAFAYGRHHRYKANLGCGMVFNGGTTPAFIPLDSF